MMFHALSGLGQQMSAATAASLSPLNATNQVLAPSTTSQTDVPQGSADCQWCASNWFAAFDPSCWAESISGECTKTQSIPQVYIQGAASTMPPSQATIDSQSPDATVNQIIADQQAAADAAATAADAVGPTNSSPGWSLLNLNSLAPGTSGFSWIIIAAVVIGGIVLLENTGKR